MEVKIEMHGVEELIAELKQFGDEKQVSKALRAALGSAGKVMRVAIQNETPVGIDGGGELKQSMTQRLVVRKDFAKAFIGPYAGKPHGKSKWRGKALTVAALAKLLEFGTSRVSARPFMSTAFSSASAAAYERIAQRLAEWISTLKPPSSEIEE